MLDHSYAMKINYVGSVIETKQMYATQDDFRLRTLVPEVSPVSKHASYAIVLIDPTPPLPRNSSIQKMKHFMVF